MYIKLFDTILHDSQSTLLYLPRLMERLEEVPQATPGFGAWLEPGDLGVRSGNHLDIGFLDFGICV